MAKIKITVLKRFKPEDVFGDVGYSTPNGKKVTACTAFKDGQEFITRNVFSNSDTALDPTEANGVYQGVTCDFWVSDATATMVGHIHGIDINGDGMIVTRVLDAQGRDSHEPGVGTLTYVVFKLVTAS